MCYGRGEALKGWPVLYPWCDPEKGFKGPSHHSVEMCTEIVSSILHHKSQEALVEEEEEGEVHAERTHEGELEQVEKDQEEGQVIGVAEKEPIGAEEENDKKKPIFVIQVGPRGMKIPKK